jgi:hypothetical protein
MGNLYPIHLQELSAQLSDCAFSNFVQHVKIPSLVSVAQSHLLLWINKLQAEGPVGLEGGLVEGEQFSQKQKQMCYLHL